MTKPSIEELESLIQPVPRANYTVDIMFCDLEYMLDRFKNDWGLNLLPEFQRGHQWTDGQRTAFVEGVLRGTVVESLLTIQFNAPHWEDDDHGGDLPDEMQIIDGLQRLTAVRMFMSGRIKAFGLGPDDLLESEFSMKRGRFRFKFLVFNLPNKKDLYQYYIDINSAGTPHSSAEIARVKAMLASL